MTRNSTRFALLAAAGAVFLTCTAPMRGGTGTGGTTGAGGGGNYSSGTGNVAPPLSGTGNTAGALVGTGNVAGGLGGSGDEGGAGSSGGAGAGVGGATGGSASGRGGATAGTTGNGGAAGTSEPARTFPTQACLTKASSILAMMTADEKIAQLHQVERANTSASDITTYGVGSVYSQGGSGPSQNNPTGWADMIDGFRKASYASRLKIPVIYGLDVVHGVGPVYGATVFPHNVGLGATRDPALVEEVARAVAEESAGVGADFPFAPVVAVARDERWGRTYEAFGETVELASFMGTAFVNGFQKRSGPFSILANAKHYLGDGGTMNGINAGNTSGDETALRALHLAPYQSAVKAGVGSIMASYSSWQGTRMHANATMINGVLKGDLGFAGFVGSDYNGCSRDGVTATACLNAGVDMFMTFGTTASQFVSMIKGLVPSSVPQSRIDDAARRILVAKCEMGLLDGNQHLVDRTLTSQVGSAAHRAVARKAVAASLVVLKNDNGALPISKSVAGVALGGKTADNVGNQCGGWTVTWQGMSGAVTTGTTVRQALEAVIPGKVGYALDGSMTGNGATVGIAVIGETPYSEGCGDIPSPNGGNSCISRPSTLSLDNADVQVVQKMKNAGLKTVVVLVAGRPMIIDAILPIADAIVVAWLPGSEGAGITDVLFGDVKPRGALPHSWPRSESQIPINQGDASYDPLFPYAFGLTY
jgi:beta-glucosidase